MLLLIYKLYIFDKVFILINNIYIYIFIFLKVIYKNIINFYFFFLYNMYSILFMNTKNLKKYKIIFTMDIILLKY